VREERIVSTAEVSMFSFVGLRRPYIPCNSQDVSTTEDALDFTKSFSSVVLVCQVVNCAFVAFRIEMVIIFGVPISLTVCTLNNIPFVFGRFEFYFTLMYVFYIKYVFVIRGRF
jgi:hypothetical protein